MRIITYSDTAADAVVDDTVPDWSGPQELDSVIIIYALAESLAEVSAPVAALDFARRFSDNLSHAVVTLRVNWHIVTVGEAFFAANENLDGWSEVFEMLRDHAPSLMRLPRAIIKDRFSGLEDLYEGFRAKYDTADQLFCVFHILGNMLSKCGKMKHENKRFWELVGSRNEEELAANWVAIANEYPDHAKYLREIDDDKFIACKIAAKGIATDMMRTSNAAEQENSRQKALEIRAQCVPRSIVEGLGVAVAAVDKIRNELEVDRAKGRVLVKKINAAYQEAIGIVGRAQVSKLSETMGKVTFTNDKGKAKTTAIVDFEARTCSRCCTFTLFQHPCHHAHAFADHVGLLKAGTQQYYDTYFAPRHRVAFQVEHLCALGNIFVPSLANLSRDLSEDLRAPAARDVGLFCAIAALTDPVAFCEQQAKSKKKRERGRPPKPDERIESRGHEHMGKKRRAKSSRKKDSSAALSGDGEVDAPSSKRRKRVSAEPADAAASSATS